MLTRRLLLGLALVVPLALLGAKDRWPASSGGGAAGPVPNHSHEGVRVQFAATALGAVGDGNCLLQGPAGTAVACNTASNTYVYSATTPTLVSLVCVVHTKGTFDVAGESFAVRPVFIQGTPGVVTPGSNAITFVGNTTVAGQEVVTAVTQASPFSGVQGLGLQLVNIGVGSWATVGIRCGYEVL